MSWRNALFLGLLVGWMTVVLAGCLPGSMPLPPDPTETPLPPTITPSPTIVWFPATPTGTPFPTLVITPTQDIRPQHGALLLTDDFLTPAAWTLGKASAGGAALGKGELTLAISQPGGYLYSLRSQPALSDFYVEITASPTICRAGDEYGLLLRVSPSLEFYRFSLTCDGQTRVDRVYRGQPSSPKPLIPSGAVPRGAPSSSKLAVLAKGSEFEFYINDELQFSMHEPTLPSGVLGVFAHSAGDNVVTVNFSSLRVFKP